MNSPTAAHLPLKGVRVLEVAQIMAGPTCGLMLADLGADVIKIEKFPHGDDARQYQKPGDSALPPSFCMINRGKRSIGLDIKHPLGKQALLRMARESDVLTENFRVGVMDRLGLGYADVQAVNPSLIYCSITGYGSTGPLAKKGGFDLILQAFTGIISATGEPGRAPVKPGISLADTNAGILAAFAILAAYVHRLKTGHGQHVQTSLLQAAMQQTYWLAANYFSSGKDTEPLGTAHSLIAPYQVFHAKDGALVIGGGNPAAWRRVCEVLGHPEWQSDDRFDHPQKRVKHRADLEALINIELSVSSVADWCIKFDAAGVPCGPVQTASQALEHEQARAIGMVIDVEDGRGGHQRGLGSPVILNQTPAVHATSPAPEVGQQSLEILQEFGFSSTEIHVLEDSGVIQA